MSDFGSFGLDSAADLGVGSCETALGFQCAFEGVNPALGPAVFLQPIGLSVYNALDVKLVYNVKAPFRGVRYPELPVRLRPFPVHELRRSVINIRGHSPAAADQDFVIPLSTTTDRGGFSGPSSLDRTHQFSFGGYADLPLPSASERSSISIARSPALSPFPLRETEPAKFSAPISRATERWSDPVPGTKQGSFMRGVSVGGASESCEQLQQHDCQTILSRRKRP
jgi:hypothetical protein